LALKAQAQWIAKMRNATTFQANKILWFFSVYSLGICLPQQSSLSSSATHPSIHGFLILLQHKISMHILLLKYDLFLKDQLNWVGWNKAILIKFVKLLDYSWIVLSNLEVVCLGILEVRWSKYIFVYLVVFSG
jgi:hypothetical protein